jgi:hypothetical protein
LNVLTENSKRNARKLVQHIFLKGATPNANTTLRLSANMRPLVPLFMTTLSRHRRCRYYQTLDYYCPVKTSSRTGKLLPTLTPLKTRLRQQRKSSRKTSVASKFTQLASAPSTHNPEEHLPMNILAKECMDEPISQLFHDSNEIGM